MKWLARAVNPGRAFMPHSKKKTPRFTMKARRFSDGAWSDQLPGIT
jgi:hypothetical protein